MLYKYKLLNMSSSENKDIIIIILLLLPARMKKIQSKMKELEC